MDTGGDKPLPYLRGCGGLVDTGGDKPLPYLRGCGGLVDTGGDKPLPYPRGCGGLDRGGLYDRPQSIPEEKTAQFR
jgi:hypothetical protein